ncbi:hypothetical protein C808_00578 [Lachnospiraceae bacterium M18-1]|nr:hypothetical protein C808_00578 [Lachnospiraceae bacterium M18-1]
MEGKEKIVLKDGTMLAIENGASVNLIQVPIQSLDGFKGLFEKFTEDNLEKYSILNAAGLTCATLENKYLEEAGVKQRENDFLVSLRLADVNMTEKRLAVVEAEQEAMKTGQTIQDGAIADLGEIVGGMMEGGEA